MMSRARSNMSDLSRLPPRRLTYLAASRPKLSDDSVHQFPAGGRSIDELVVEPHRLPFEGAHLVKWLDLDPLDVRHRRDESRDAVDVGGGVGFARNKREADPNGLGQR